MLINNAVTRFYLILTIIWSYLRLCANIELTITKTVAKSTTILMTMPPGGYGKMCIAQSSASVAPCKATRCRQWVRACIALPPMATMVNDIEYKHKNTNKTHPFACNYCIFYLQIYQLAGPKMDPLLSSLMH